MVSEFVNWDPGFEFDFVLEGRENEEWEALKRVIHGFLWNKRDDNYTQFITLPQKTVNSVPSRQFRDGTELAASRE